MSLKQWLAAKLRSLANWLDPVAKSTTITIPNDETFNRTKVLVEEQENFNPASGFGESKRHQVLSQLLKEFPTRTDLGKVIEVAVEHVLGVK